MCADLRQIRIAWPGPRDCLGRFGKMIGAAPRRRIRVARISLSATLAKRKLYAREIAMPFLPKFVPVFMVIATPDCSLAAR
jgi:hypothetical protein